MNKAIQAEIDNLKPDVEFKKDFLRYPYKTEKAVQQIKQQFEFYIDREIRTPIPVLTDFIRVGTNLTIIWFDTQRIPYSELLLIDNTSADESTLYLCLEEETIIDGIKFRGRMDIKAEIPDDDIQLLKDIGLIEDHYSPGHSYQSLACDYR